MVAYLNDIAYWVNHWTETGETISDSVAHRIAHYWQISVGLDDISAAISYARSAGIFEPTLPELYALKAWALEHG